MAHVRGHVIKKSWESITNLSDYPSTGIFFKYINKVIDYHSEYGYISDSDSKDRENGDNIFVLSNNNSLDDQQDRVDFDIVLKVQSFFDYTDGWTLNDKNNWLVYDPNMQHLSVH